jgi:integrase/recombinase XerD
MGENRGNKAVSINTYLRCLKAFLRWCHEEGILKEPVKLSWLKEEQKILATFTEGDIKRLLNYSPRKREKVNRFGGSVEVRLHTLVCLLLDTGIRIGEATRLFKKDCEFDNLTIRVLGKGNKQRQVPMSIELRKLLWRYFKDSKESLVFATRTGTQISQRDFLRDFKKLGQKLGITGVRISAHTCRHTFAVFWLRRGGDLYRLSRVLGHESIETTTKYLKSLGIEDLQATHQQVSLLSPLSARR